MPFTRDQLIAGMKAADAAGNEADAQHFANLLKDTGEPITGYSRAVIAEGNKPSGRQLTADRILEAGQGMVPGWFDEFVGGIGGVDSLLHGKGFLEGYHSTTERARNDQKAYEGDRPGEALAVRAAGMIPTLVAGASLAQPALRSGNVASLGKRAIDAFKTGALFGGVEGAGDANGDLSDRAGGALTGAGVGGVLGSAFPLVPAGVRGAFRMVNQVGQPAEEFSATAVARALEGDHISLPAARTAVQSGKTLLDVGGPSTIALAEQGALQGEGRATAEKFFGSEDASREGKVLQRVRNIVSDQPLYDRMDELSAKRAQDARPLYDAAYAAPYRRTPKLVDLSKRSWVGGAARTAITRLKNDPDIDPADVDAAMGPIFGDDPANLSDAQASQRLTQAMGTRPVEFKVLDYIKRGLDAMAEDPSASKEVRKLRNAWRGELKSINPKYQEALSAWAGPSATLDSLELGRTFDKMDPEAIAREMTDMGESERDAFRVGASRRIQDLASGAGSKTSGGVQASAGLAKNIAGNRVMQSRLRAVLGDEGADAQTMLGRNGWTPKAAGQYENASQPGARLSVDQDGRWTLEQTSKTGRSSSIKNGGADQSSLESFLTGQPVAPKPGSADDLIQMAQQMSDRILKKGQVIGNSATARRLEGSANFDSTGATVDNVAQALDSVKKGGILGGVAHALGISKDYLLQGLTSARRAEVSKLLMSDDKEKVLQALDMIQNLRKGKVTPPPLYKPGVAVPAVTGVAVGNSVNQ